VEFKLLDAVLAAIDMSVQTPHLNEGRSGWRLTLPTRQY
jgi:hypothetical protein